MYVASYLYCSQMNRVIRWNDIERESLPRLLSQVRVHSEKNFNTRAVPLAHACVTPRTRVHYLSTLVYYPSDTSVRGSRVRRCIKSVLYLYTGYYGIRELRQLYEYLVHIHVDAWYTGSYHSYFWVAFNCNNLFL